MNGLLIYHRSDYDKNKTYINWLRDTASGEGMTLHLRFSDELLRAGIAPGDRFDFVINRSRSYELSVLFELNGLKVFNSSDVTRLGNHKLSAYRYAQSKGIAFAPVLVSWNHRKTLISKPISGHGGQGIEVVPGNVPFDETRFQQELIDNAEGDMRFYIIHNELIHCVLRKASSGFLSNYSQGGLAEYYHYSPAEQKLVLELIRGLDIDYAGVDFLLLKDGSLLFNEIEDVVGSRMLSALGKNNTTELFLTHIRQTLGQT